MFGKVFGTMFTGSMVGTGPMVYVVMTYAIACGRDGLVEINPPVLAALIGKVSAKEVKDALDVLTSPDPESRSPEEEGRRLVHEGAFIYRIVNFEQYRNMRDDNDRRAYMRDLMRKRRAAAKPGGQEPVSSPPDLLSPVSSGKPALAKADAEPEGETEKRERLARSSSDDDFTPFGFLLADGSEYFITEGQLAEYEAAYPGVDMKREFAKMRTWCSSHPRERKTRRGAAAFANRWLDRAQNDATRNKPRGGRDEQTSGGTPSDRPLQRKPRK